MQMERRKQRSEYKDQALQLWLSSVAQKNKLVGLVLADRAGLLVASTMSRSYSEEVAARAPYISTLGVKLDSPTGRPVTVHEIVVGETPLFLCAVGQQQADLKSLNTAEGGVKRILGPN
jgi:hypothetical protein